jgi:hypothetical protein
MALDEALNHRQIGLLGPEAEVLKPQHLPALLGKRLNRHQRQVLPEILWRMPQLVPYNQAGVRWQEP